MRKCAWPVRVRLTVWYSTVLALCLIAFGATVWLGLRQSLTEATTAELRERFDSLRRILIAEAGESGATEVTTREEMAEFSAALPREFTVEMSDANGAPFIRGPGGRLVRGVEQQDTIEAGGRSYRVRLVASLEPVDEILRRLSRILLFSIPLALLIASLGGYWLSGRALRPVREMALAAGGIGSGNLTSRLPAPAARDELSLLANMWNEMLDRIEDSVARTRQFTSDASHDLRTPLAAIRASAEIALRRPREPNEYVLTLEGILRQTDRAVSLVESLLNLARAENGREQRALAPVDLTPLVEEACETLRPAARARNLDLRLAAGTGPIWIKGDRETLTRAVLELVDNAIKNTEEGSVDVELTAHGGVATLVVSDTGVGIDAGDVPHIFDRFYRGDQSRNAAQGGFGLGLAIARESIARHGGAIEVESSTAKGSRFSIRLPLAADRAAPGG